MSKRTIIHLFLRILLVPAIPFFVMVYVLQGLENGKLMIALFAASVYTALYLILECVVFLIKGEYRGFKLNIILLIIIVSLFMTKTFREIMELDTAFR